MTDDDYTHQRITEFASKLQADMAFAAPELFLLHAERRMGDLVDALADDDETEAYFVDALAWRALMNDPKRVAWNNPDEVRVNLTMLRDEIEEQTSD